MGNDYDNIGKWPWHIKAKLDHYYGSTGCGVFKRGYKLERLVKTCDEHLNLLLLDALDKIKGLVRRGTSDQN